MTTANFPYYNAVDQIYNAEWLLAKLARLELLRQSVQALWPNGHPTRLIHVVGTSGKGSTSRFLEMAFATIGVSGAFMSPHLFDYRERFSINGEFVSQDDIVWAWETRVRPHCIQLARHNAHHAHTFHEVSILIALALFEKYQVTWAAMEASVGGRYDQTRALDVAAAVVTNVGADHANLLGKEQWQRVLDKAGCARPAVPLFTTDREAANVEIIRAVCQQAGAPFHWVGPTLVSELEQKLAGRQDLGVEPGLLQAGHQKWNAALALAVLRHFYPQVDDAAVLTKLAQAQLLGRLWQVSERLYADIAHNAEKISALVTELSKRFGDRGKIFVIGLSGHRTAREVFANLAQQARAIIVTSASYKGQEPEKIRAELTALVGDIPILVIKDPQQALRTAQAMQGENDIVVLTGSTYTIEQALNPDPYLRSLNSSFGWRSAIDTEAHGSVQLTLPKPPLPLR